MADRPVEIDTPHGRLRGQRRPEGLAFLGVPYGASTAGTGRFGPPQPVAPWAGVRDATAHGPRCPQLVVPRHPLFAWLHSEQGHSEDCLTLNVHTPALDGRPRPVLVWLHGGAFAFGSANAPVYDGSALAARGDVVVVTVNHRLNVLGFMPPVLAGEPLADSGNAGLLDLVAALRWVQTHIAAFGGDPGCVTLFGQSGGGAKVVILHHVAAARGLFHRAIVQSASSGFRVQTPEDAQRQGHALLRQLGLGPQDGAALQQCPEATLRQAMAHVVAAEGGDDHFRPVIDGRTLHDHPGVCGAGVAGAGVPLLIGATATEATFFLAADPARGQLSLAQVQARLQRFMKLDAAATQQVMQRYAAHHPGARPAQLLGHIASDHAYRLNTVEGALARAAVGDAPVHLYRFDWHCPALGGVLRTPHTAEIPFVFGHVQHPLAQAFTGGGAAAVALQHQVMDTWLRFARTGHPNGPGLPHWPALDAAPAAPRQTLLFDTTPDGLHTRVVADPDGDDLAVMATVRRFVPGAAMSFRAD